MNDDIAKLHLSIKDGVFEISGSENFVTTQIENFKEIISDALKIKGMQHHYLQRTTERLILFQHNKHIKPKRVHNNTQMCCTLKALTLE